MNAYKTVSQKEEKEAGLEAGWGGSSRGKGLAIKHEDLSWLFSAKAKHQVLVFYQKPGSGGAHF